MSYKTSKKLLERLYYCEAFNDFVEDYMRQRLLEMHNECDIPWPQQEDREYYKNLKPALARVINHMSTPENHIEIDSCD